jgi:hypothetical protein
MDSFYNLFNNSISFNMVQWVLTILYTYKHIYEYTINLKMAVIFR